MITENKSPPSALFRKQIGNLSLFMHSIVSGFVSDCSKKRNGLRNIKSDFMKIEDKAYRNCFSLDQSPSIESTDRTLKAIYALLEELISLKNQARKLVEKEKDTPALIERFQNQLGKVEEWMNESMQLFVNGPFASKRDKERALEALTRWSELYRHGLKASIDIPAHGRQWLIEAHKRLDMTIEALQELDAKNGAVKRKRI